MQMHGKMVLHYLWRHNRNQKARAAPFCRRSFIKRFRAKNSLKFQLFIDCKAIYKKTGEAMPLLFFYFLSSQWMRTPVMVRPSLMISYRVI